MQTPRPDAQIVMKQIEVAEDMLLVSQRELEYERERMLEAQHDEKRVVALTEFLGRAEERKNLLYPFNSIKDDYMSAGFGGVQVDDLDKCKDYLRIVVSNARSKEGEVQRLENMIALLEEDIAQLKAISGAGFKNFLSYMTTKDIWWGQSALSIPAFTR